jgi:hypothetical protein
MIYGEVAEANEGVLLAPALRDSEFNRGCVNPTLKRGAN